MNDEESRKTVSTDAVGSAEDAFSLVANEIRMNILLALWEADEPLSFSELRERVGVRDSGRFNYHLNALVDRFVRKAAPSDDDETLGGEGYVLRDAGRRVVGAVYSGVYTQTVSVDSVPVDGTCHVCGRGLVASYDDDQAVVKCSDCEISIWQIPVPPAVVEERSLDDFPTVIDEWGHGQLELARRGFCMLCNGPTTPSLERNPADSDHVDTHQLIYTCRRCGLDVQSVIGAQYLTHPAVVAFHLDHGIDPSTAPLWDLDWLFEPHTTLERDGSPPFEVHVELDGERLVVRVDEGFRVLETNRTTT